MRILFIAPSLELGGVSRYVIGLSNELEKLGHEIFFVTRLFKNDMKISNKNINIIDISYEKIGISRTFNVISQISKILNKEKIDLIIANTSFSTLLGIIARLFGGKRTSIEILRIVHGMWRREIESGPEATKVYGSKIFEAFLPVFSGPIERFAIRKSDHIIAVSKQIKEYLLSHYGERKIPIIPAGVDTDIFTPHPRKKDGIKSDLGLSNITTILFVGVIREVKGLRYLIESLKEVVREFEIQVLVVGDGPDLPKCIRLIHDQRLEDNFIFVGSIIEDLPKYYQASDIFCLPSLSEGLPQTLLEAMSCGLPVISTDVGGIPNLVKNGNNGLLVSPSDVNALAVGIKHIIENETIAIELGEAARVTIVEEYSWRSISKKLLRAIDVK